MVKGTKENNGIHKINVDVKCASVSSTVTQTLPDGCSYTWKLTTSEC